MTYEDEVIEQFLDGYEYDYGLEGEDEDDDLELLGRRRRRGRSRSRRPTRSRFRPSGRARKPARRPSSAFKGQAAGVALTTPNQARLLTLGLDSVADVAASAQATVNGQPQVVFRPDKLTIPLAVGINFLINDLKIGKNSMFISAVGVPAEAFAHDAQGVGLKMDTAQVSQIISIIVTNLDAVNAHRFTAALVGPSVE